MAMFVITRWYSLEFQTSRTTTADFADRMRQIPGLRALQASSGQGNLGLRRGRSGGGHGARDGW